MFSILSLLLIVVCLLGSVIGQTQRCTGTYQMSLHAVESPNSPQIGPQMLSFSLPQSSSDEPSFTLFAAYKYSMINLKIEQPRNQPHSEFTINMNGQQSKQTYHYQAGGNLIKLAPFLSQGTAQFSNQITVDLTDHNADGSVRCTSTNVFNIVNPAAFPGM